MGITDRVWAALTSMIKLEDKVVRQSEAIKSQQIKLEHLTERVIRVETTLDLLMRAQASSKAQVAFELARIPTLWAESASGRRQSQPSALLRRFGCQAPRLVD